MRRLQSAMEYLMTYGWAILAIAIVMVSLYSLGIFNTGSLQPTATPGSCEVIRTVAQTSLAGQCNNLIPKYVGKFNGVNSYIPATSRGFPVGASNISIFAWIDTTGKPASASYSQEILDYGYNSANELVQLVIRNGPNGYETYLQGGTIYGGAIVYGPGYGNGPPIYPNTWYFVGFVLGSNGVANLYVDNSISTSTTISYMNLVNGGLQIGESMHCACNIFNGSIADIQVYNASLDNATIKALYQEGIGGAPIDVNHIVAWYPLNGNANDYSGNNNQGTPTSVVWNANWQSGYAAPTS